ncbi:MAG: TonB-dependent receptor [Tannerella sp.]|jgi:TonB-linked SusC/RagA family outer membrane protein|nr:TonB-dependent receptor [Tannerella sp.]
MNCQRKNLSVYIKTVIMFLVITFPGTLISSAGIYAGTTFLSIKVKNKPIREVFSQIESQSKFVFFYHDDALDLDRKVSVDVTNETIDKILDILFKNSDSTYKISDRQIFIQKANFETVEPQQKVITVEGTVTDHSGETLPGVTIRIKGTTRGVITNNDGRYNFVNVPENAVLIFSYVGFATREVAVAKKQIIDVKLSEQQQELGEIVVVGYGAQKKETMVGAVTQINNKSLVQSGTVSVTNAIAGKLSGVLTMQQTGEPGNDDAEIIIRGLSSWNSSQPLVLVDGVERDFKDLDPNEINTISVLKDASATAVFGARGANGVIIVTTKRGQEGTPKLDVSVSFGFDKATRIPDHIDSYTTMSMLNVAKMNEQQFTELIPQYQLNEYKNPSSKLNALRYPDVNWFDEVTKPFAPTANANLNVIGGTSFVKYFASLGYSYQGSYFDGYKDGYDDSRFWYNRFNYRTNLDFNLTKTTILSFNIGGEVGIKNQPTIGNIWWTLYGTSPARFPAYYPSWVLEEYPDPDYPNDKGIRYADDFGEYTNNPYTVFHEGAFNRYLDSKLFTDVFLKQNLDFLLKGLSAQGKVSLSTYYRNLALTASRNFPEYQFIYENIGTGKSTWFREGQGNEVYKEPPLSINIGGLQNSYYNDLYYEFSLNYARTFGSHTVSALALMNRQQKNRTVNFPYYNEGLVGRLTYDFQRKYLAEFNLGYTGSERFAPGNCFGFFPSCAMGWVISEEEFFKKTFPWFNKFKMRYSDGLVGSDMTDSRWLYISDYYKDSRGYIREDKAANSRAQWEEARKQDLGIELGFLKNTISIGIDLFNEYRTNMLLVPKSTPMLLGIQFKELNLGELKKHGIEVEAEYRNNIAKKFNYFVKGIFSFNENRIMFKDDPAYTPEYQKEAGKLLGAQTSGVKLTGNGYFNSVDEIHISPSPIALSGLNIGDYKFLDYTADGIISSLDAYPIEGSKYPVTVYSFSSGFTYNNFEFSFLFQGNQGKYVEYNQNFEAEFTKGNWSVHASQLDYWTPTNPDAGHSTLHYPGTGYIRNLAWLPATEAIGYTTYIEGRFWRKADYLKLKEVYLGYTLEPRMTKRYGISFVNIFVTGNNLLTFTNLIEGDPERKDFSKGFYPQLMSMKIGLKISF